MTQVDETYGNDSRQMRTQLDLRRWNLYFVLGVGPAFVLLLLAGLRSLGIGGLDDLPSNGAAAMTALAILLLVVVSVGLLSALRRTSRLMAQDSSEAKFVQDRKQAAQLAARSTLQPSAPSNPPAARPKIDRRWLAGVTRVPRPSNPFDVGDVHRVRDVEGVGDLYGPRLESMGIADTQRLWKADAAQVAQALDLPLSIIQGWQAMAELMAVRDISRQHAELLLRARITSIRALCAAHSSVLRDRIHQLERERGDAAPESTIGIRTVDSWISAAQFHLGFTRIPPMRSRPQDV